MSKLIWIPVAEAEIDKEYYGYQSADTPNSIYYCTIMYKGNGTGWVWNRESNVAHNITFLERYATFEEEREISRKKPNTTLNLFGLFNDMSSVGDAYHEMWNAWIDCDFYDMNTALHEEESTLVGIAPAPYKWNWPEECVAFVAETNNGDRFWCHGSKDMLEDMREQMKEIYNEINSNH